MRGRTIRTPEKRAAFLSSLAEGHSVATAAKAAGFGRRTAFEWKRDDAEFAQEWEDAYEAGSDALEDEAKRRAFDGSDTLLIFLLKGRRPEKFRDKVALEHTGKDGGPILNGKIEIEFVAPNQQGEAPASIPGAVPAGEA